MYWFCLGDLSRQDSNSEKKKKVGLLLIKAVLSIPNITYNPHLDQVQTTVNHAVEIILSVMKGVGQWAKDRFMEVGLAV